MDIARIRKKLKGEGKKAGPGADASSSDTGRGLTDGQDENELKGVSTPDEGQSPRPDEAESEDGNIAETEGAPQAGKPEMDVALTEPFERSKELEVVVFSLGGEMYAFHVSDVEELLRPHRITSVPMTSPYLLGVTSVRGRIVPVLDIERRLTGSGGGRRMGESKILILRGPKGSVGVQVGASMEFVRLAGGDVVEPPAHLHEPASKFIEGVVPIEEKFVSIVNTEELLNFNITREA